MSQSNGKRFSIALTLSTVRIFLPVTEPLGELIREECQKTNLLKFLKNVGGILKKRGITAATAVDKKTIYTFYGTPSIIRERDSLCGPDKFE